VHEDAARKREHLGFILKAAKGSREDETVVVALKLSAVVAVLFLALQSKPFGAE
jgi:hypothetical protein